MNCNQLMILISYFIPLYSISFHILYMVKFSILIDFSGGHLGKYWGGGQAYCFGRMKSHISIVLERVRR